MEKSRPCQQLWLVFFAGYSVYTIGEPIFILIITRKKR